MMSSGTGAVIYVFSEDHCPPHVHARHRGEEWVARVRFSFLEDTVRLMSIAPLRNSPSHRSVNRLLGDIQTGLPACRRLWWTNRQTTCLEDQWAIVSPMAVSLVSRQETAAKRIDSAFYDVTSERVVIHFHDGTASTLRGDL